MPAGAIWTADEETVFVDFLVDNKSEVGDGGKFKAPTFQWAANHIATFHECGPIKIAYNKQTTLVITVTAVFFMEEEA
ncbi:hypothetical protein K443DRAFT_11292 [Laccaria amethystina LaAM-08-1]|uniref:Uncharacterized protein n=1 Tax=Laccaria amethystina LaAM-08-1 TaxID=1095629 RepID=A0A0C9XHH0_9AGAR|nr:hypothetical protein K443DRAFT_11292 [Laccaria amethystina LaAM-08-1]